MALKAIINTLEEAPEGVRDQYQAGSDGKFVLAVEAVDGFALEHVTGLKTALGKERTRAETAERNLTRFADLDPDTARTALARVLELEAIDPSKEADKMASAKVEAATKSLTTKFTTEIAARDDKLGKLGGLVDNLARRQAAIAAIAEAKGSVDLLLPHVLGATKAEIGDDGVTVKVFKDGIEAVNNQGAPMSIAELVAEMRGSDTFARAFEGANHSGSGKQTDNPPGPKAQADFGGDRKQRAAAIAQKFKLPA